MAKTNMRSARKLRHVRVRAKLSGTQEKPRLCVFRSLNNIYAQIIDDTAGHTLASAGSLDPEIKGQLKDKNKTESAELIGSLIAKRAVSNGISKVVFDRGGYKYHGRVKALADGARKAGLDF